MNGQRGSSGFGRKTGGYSMADIGFFCGRQGKNSMEQSEKVDFIMTLDNISLVAAGE